MRKDLLDSNGLGKLQKFGEVGSFLFSSLVEQQFQQIFGLKASKFQLYRMKELTASVAGLKRLALSLFACKVSVLVNFFEKENLLKLTNVCFKTLEVSDPSKFYYEHYYTNNDLTFNSKEVILEHEIRWYQTWYKAVETGLLDFDNRFSYGESWQDTGKSDHDWHGYCGHTDSREYYDKDPGPVKSAPLNKRDLIVCLKCAVASIQLANAWDGIEPIGRIMKQMSSYENYTYGESFKKNLYSAMNDWMTKLVLCEKCKVPGCIGYLLCPTSPIIKAALDSETSDPFAFGDIYHEVYELAPEHKESIDNLQLFFTTQRIMEVVVSFGFAASKVFDAQGYEIAMKAIHQPEGAKNISALLKNAGIVATSGGALFCGLEELAELAGVRTEPEPSTLQETSKLRIPFEKITSAVQAIRQAELGNVCLSEIEEMRLFASIQKYWLNRKVVLSCESCSDFSQRLQVLRNLGPCLSVEFTNLATFPQRHRDLVANEFFPACKKINSQELNHFIDSILLAAFAISAMPENANFVMHKNSFCVCTEEPELIVKKLHDIGVDFLECYSDDALFINDCAFTNKYARATNVVSAFKRLFTVNERLLHAEKSLIVNEYASAAWSLVNRTANKNAAVPFTTQMHQVTGLDPEICRKILKGDLSVAFGPVRKAKDGVVEVLLFGISSFRLKFDEEGLPEVEIEALQYLKTQSHSSDYHIVSIKVESEPVSETQNSPFEAGYLSSFKHLSQLKNYLNREQLEQVLRITGSPRQPEAYKAAWGSEGVPKIIHGALPYESQFTSTNTQVSYQIFY